MISQPFTAGTILCRRWLLTQQRCYYDNLVCFLQKKPPKMLGVLVCMPVMQRDALKKSKKSVFCNRTPLRPHIDLTFKTLNNLVLSLIHPLALDLEFSCFSAGHSGSSWAGGISLKVRDKNFQVWFEYIVWCYCIVTTEIKK